MIHGLDTNTNIAVCVNFLQDRGCDLHKSVERIPYSDNDKNRDLQNCATTLTQKQSQKYLYRENYLLLIIKHL